jgi:hypothetical protein
MPQIASVAMAETAAVLNKAQTHMIFDITTTSLVSLEIVAERSGGRRVENWVFQLVSMIKMEDVFRPFDRRWVPFVST